MRRGRRVFCRLVAVLIIGWLAYPSSARAFCAFNSPITQGGALGRPPGHILTGIPGAPVAGFWWELGMGDPALGVGNDLGSTEVPVPPTSDAPWISRIPGDPVILWDWLNAGTDGCPSGGAGAGVMIAYLLDGGDHYVIAAVNGVDGAHDFDTVVTGVGPNGNDLPLVSRTDGVAPQLSNQASDPGTGDICADVAAAIAGINVFYGAGGPYPDVADTSNLTLVHRIPGGGVETPLSCDPETGCTAVCWPPARELCWQGDAGAIANDVVIGGICSGGVLHGFPCDPDDPASTCVAFGGTCVPELDRVFFGPPIPGGCAPLSPCDGVDCDDSNACTADSCDPASGTCINADISSTCDDADVCTQDSCDPAMGCVNQDISTCDDANLCTADICDPFAGTCTNDDISAACDDGNSCTADACDPAVGCVNNDITSTCNDGNVCTADSCIPFPICVGGGLDGFPCDDEDPASSCVAFGGTCPGGCINQAISCDDGNACTADTCDPAVGCVHTDISASCDDGSICTADSCDPAVGCVNNDLLLCDDGNACTADSCHPITGECTNGDGTCNDGNVCTVDICDPAVGCVNDDLFLCDDGNACTTDNCDPVTGACANDDASAACIDGNACTADSCDPAVGCVNQDITATCDDSDSCTADSCVPVGTCVGGGLHGFPCDAEDPASSCVAFGGTCLAGCLNEVHPEVNDALDNQCPGDPGFGLIDELSGDAGFHNPADNSEYSWPGQAFAMSYEVTRSTSPDLSTDCEVLISSDTFLLSSVPLSPGVVSYHVVRPLTPNPGSWGEDSFGVERLNGCP